MSLDGRIRSADLRSATEISSIADNKTKVEQEGGECETDRRETSAAQRFAYGGNRRVNERGTGDRGGPAAEIGIIAREDIVRFAHFRVKKADGSFSECDASWTRPQLDFGFVRYEHAESEERALPEYASRSLIMTDDYAVLYEDVRNESTEGILSWGTSENDELSICLLKPAALRETAGTEPADKSRDGRESLTNVRQFEGNGSFLAFVSQREDALPFCAAYGCQVRRPGERDYVFRSSWFQQTTVDGILFEGTAGFVRLGEDGRCDAALFRGKRIAAGGITVVLEAVGADKAEAGFSFRVRAEGVGGEVVSGGGCTLKLNGWPAGRRQRVFVDSQPAECEANDSTLSVRFPPGRHTWMLTAAEPGTD